MKMRMKEVNIVNKNLILKVVWKMFKNLVKEKMKKRLLLNGNEMK